MCLTARGALHWFDMPGFDHWGAVMYPFGRYRDLCRAAGLNLVRTARALPSDRARWVSNVRRQDGADVDLDEHLWFVRLLLYLGFHSDAARRLRSNPGQEASSSGQLATAYLAGLLAYLGGTADRWDPTALASRMHAWRGSSTPLAFTSALFLASFTTRIAQDPRAALAWFEVARALIPTSEPASLIATARLERHMWAWRRAMGAGAETDIPLLEAVEQLNATQAEIADNDVFLRVEAARRIYGVLANAALRIGNYRDAQRFSERAAHLDPYCPQALVLAGEAAQRAGDRPAAIRYFERTILTGVVERAFALRRLAELGARTFAERYDQLEAYELDAFWSISVPDRFTHPPIELAEVRDLATRVAGDPRRRRQIEHSEVYGRLGMFWHLHEVAEPQPSPSFARLPLRAFHLLDSEVDPFFSSVYTQHCYRVGIRDQLLAAAAPGAQHDPLGLFGRDLAELSAASEQMADLNSRMNALNRNSSTLWVAAIARVLGYLGFIPDALRIAERKTNGGPLSPAEAYLGMTALFLRTLGYKSTGFEAAAEQLWTSIPEREDTLRTRLTVSINAGVFQAGTMRSPDGAARWRERGIRVLDAIDRCTSFSALERHLLTSRFYRFASFVPYLRNDRALLEIETSLFEREARAIILPDVIRAGIEAGQPVRCSRVPRAGCPLPRRCSRRDQLHRRGRA